MDLLSSTLAEGSKKTYRQAWATYEYFCSDFFDTLPSLPISEAEMSLYLTFLKSYQPNTVFTYSSAVSHISKLYNSRDPLETFTNKKMLTAHKKRTHAQPKRHPITLDMLHQILQKLNHTCTTDFQKRLFKALFSLLYHACARVGELAKSGDNTSNIIQLDQIHIHHNKEKMSVDFRTYKHNDETALVYVYTNNQYCPVQLIMSYLKLRGSTNGPLFIHGNGVPVTREEVAKALKDTLTLINYDPNKYNTHSFRIGRLCQAAENGASETQLRLLGRWKSNAFLSYLRPLANKH